MRRDAAVLQLQDLGFAWPGQPPLFDGLSLHLPAGLVRLDAERGKTTLLRILAGGLPAQLQATLNGRPWTPSTEASAACLVDPADPAWSALTPGQVKSVMQSRHAGFDPTRWQRLLHDFDLHGQDHKTMHMLSTGMRRKVALAAALAAGATLTLLDEPTAGLDLPAIDALVQELQRAADDATDRSWLVSAGWGLESRLRWAGVVDF